ncbi:UDP-glycosyltransferase UGT5-like [Musca vetustissima]|uniref:UDP-glycosyltransferase UGT5-like n=1 Tax=Musca vetustissima TaxID=27455 RepID=UPI002AB75F5B|nr:UDP-glycosyltransferase UGT5-like [Musca vetustissima]
MSYKLVINILVLLPLVNSAKILGIFPIPSPSHYILMVPYLKELAARGHEVTSISGFPQKENITNFRDVAVMEVFDNYDEMIADIQQYRSKWDEMGLISEFMVQLTEKVLKNPGVQNLLKTEQFDLVVLESVHMDALYSFARHFQAPLIGSSSFGTDPIIDELMGNMSPFSYTPLVTIGYTERMSYRQRMRNVIYQVMELFHVRWVHLPRQRQLMAKYMPHIKEDLWDLRTNFSLMLLNEHFSLNFPRPFLPNMIEVGGLQLTHKTIQPLPEDIQQFLNSSTEDVIYFSLGSNVKSKDFSPERLEMIVNIFKKLPYKILWKFENPHLPGKPDNVLIKPWFPQTDVLAHPRVKLFISHGGLLSTTESIYHGKPMLGLPVFYDQMKNINKATQAGYALSLDFFTFPGDKFEASIWEMMTNDKYYKKAKEISGIYHDQPMKPLDLAVYWTEYVIRHRGAAHLQNPAQKMNFLQKHSIDTVGVLILVAGLIAIAVVYEVHGYYLLCHVPAIMQVGITHNLFLRLLCDFAKTPLLHI